MALVVEMIIKLASYVDSDTQKWIEEPEKG